MAAIQKIKNKYGEITSYRITVSMGYDHGQKICKSTTYRPKETAPSKIDKEVNKFAVEFENAVLEGSAGLSGDKLLFKDFVKIWEDKGLKRKVLDGSITSRSKEDYIKIMKNHVIPTIGKKKLVKITSTDIDDLITALLESGKSKNTVRNVYNTIQACLEYARKKKYIKYNPCQDCDPLPKVESDDVRQHIFNEDQAQRFLSEALIKEYDINIGGRNHKTEKRSIPLQHRVYFTLALYSGCRRGELIALNWEDIDSVNGIIRINKAVSRSDEKGLYIKDPKTKAGKRSVDLPGECFDLLNLWKEEQQQISDELGSAWVGFHCGRDYDKNPVFIQTDSGKRMHVETPSHKFKQI